jgi:hypothetical protein
VFRLINPALDGSSLGSRFPIIPPPVVREIGPPGGGADVPKAAVGMSGLQDSAFALKSAIRSFRLPDATRGRWLSLLAAAEGEDDGD